MPSPNALRYLRPICVLLALASLTACANSKLVTKAVEVPVPVRATLPSSLTADCEPKYRYSADDLTVEAIVDRLAAVEVALAICRNQFEVIRAMK